VRGYDDAVVAYPVSQNIHRDGILHTSTVPAPSHLSLRKRKKLLKLLKHSFERLIT